MTYITLSQLNRLIGEKLQQAFPETCWVIAETSDVRLNRSGHCYLELLEKRESDATIIAKSRAYIWASVFEVLKPYFEQATGQSFVSGLKVLLNVGVEYHPVYGMGLCIYDIDPAYTAGDMVQQRQKIFQRLQQDGVAEMNKELSIPPTPQRIAVVTSPSAAGYEDFLDHLLHNSQGFVFYPRLFPAVMQGEQTEKSVIAALNLIFERQDRFDAVVIIRGGGASSDLAAFDSYELASNVAQFPLPVITGIGHERDETILDWVAKQRCKTPTAVADFLIATMREADDALKNVAHRLPLSVNNRIEKERMQLRLLQNNLQHLTAARLQNERNQLHKMETFFRLSSPEYILAKGYSVTLKNGKAVKSADVLTIGDRIETRLYQGQIHSLVTD
ncbi:MAG: exodeoxyribonuclease VII large subunit [Candidatus Symbiothrix sp.]|jgi:exodeoxyribonuclease VII large subunit|nr:exodeoxyribonuclease VII large subunit [Candidatus Symbiothrix sp.]